VGFYFIGFALANIVAGIPALSGSALLLLALIGFGFAFWDYQIQTKFKTVKVGVTTDGGEEDGI
jgi:PTS system N-acetylgalactosamine-specific IIC component